MDKADPNSWAEVTVLCPPYRTLTYRIPEAFLGVLRAGHRVLAPLGRRKVTGIISVLSSSCLFENARFIEDVLDPHPLLSPELLELTRWAADYYLASPGETLRAALPPGLVQESKSVVRILSQAVPEESGLSETEKKLVKQILKAKNLTVRALKKEWDREGIYYALGRIEKAGVIRVEQKFTDPGVSIRTQKWISLRRSIDEESLEAIRRKAPKQAFILSELGRLGGEVKRADVDAEFPVLKRLEKAGWIEIWEQETFRDGAKDILAEPFVAHSLTPSQKGALEEVEAQLGQNTFGVFLVHGVTASGKTRLYIEAVRSALSRGKTALVLIPEISLTPQAVARYRGVFGKNVAVLHSGLSAGERYDSWRNIREGRCKIALGPRSAVFAPLSNLGLIIVDEEHEGSYKQSDPAPRYHARDTAVFRGRLNQCTVILGSATPSLESYANAISGKYKLCRLPERVDRVPMPSVSIADIRDTRKDHPVLTPLLREKIQTRIDRGEQVILLLNRRGYASFLQCGSCGAIENCLHCAISLTFHQKSRQLKCHTCGFAKPAMDACPDCGGSRLRFRGMGTERIEEEIRAGFPQARLLRMDLDTTRKKGAHAKIVFNFEKRKSDILLGTQMVAKGHDFPGVTLVGIVSADTGLYFPDFRSGERTFQLLTQAAGRAGRKDIPGEVVIQTATPEHPVILFTQTHDYEAFYHWEIEHRRELGYPPIGRLVLAEFRGADLKRTSEAARMFFEWTDCGSGVERLGPVPSPISKIRGQYRFSIIYRQDKNLDPSGKTLRDMLRSAIQRFEVFPQFGNIHIHLNVDPVDML